MSAPPNPGDGAASPSTKDLFKLSLGALGVVFGDIGTSPLYAIRECFAGQYSIDHVRENVLGVLSLVTWVLLLVITIKYLVFVLRADNRGEGGTLALLALALGRKRRAATAGKAMVIALGLFGTALIYGEGIVTPALSVLAALEGLSVATTAFSPYVVPVALVILVALFWFQRRGTSGVGAVFGPVMVLWFITIAALGLRYVIKHPAILAAVNPLYGVRLLATHGLHGYLLLAAVVLVITGGEALYADMGHFGRKPIRSAWLFVAMPALLINYYGQGALLLEHGAAVVKNPFFALAPSWFLYPLVALSTLAAVIASQALISGAFSLTQQAVQLGYWPRVAVVHTSRESEGQIYIPEINWALMVACLALVLGFRSSGRLAAAYGIAVTGAMSITSVLLFVVARRSWGWSLWRALPLCAAFFAIDFAFFTANLAKFTAGGWVPLAVGVLVFTIMTTWKRGREQLGQFFTEHSLPLDLFLADVEATKPHRVRGTAVFMTSTTAGAPQVLLHHFKHNQVLHEQVVLLSIVTERVPTVPTSERVKVEDLGQGFYRVIAHYGFMESPNVMNLFRRCAVAGLNIVPEQTSFYLGRETLLVTRRTKMARWRKVLFSFLSRNARPATAFFSIPPGRVVELGAQVEL